MNRYLFGNHLSRLTKKKIQKCSTMLNKQKYLFKNYEIKNKLVLKEVLIFVLIFFGKLNNSNNSSLHKAIILK